MFFTENWHVVFSICNVVLTDKLFHLVPLENHSTVNTASNMSRNFAVLVVALDAASFISLQAVMASQIESLEVQLTSNLVLLLISEINFWCPVYTNNMGPNVLSLINASHDSLNFITKEALDILALKLLV